MVQQTYYTDPSVKHIQTFSDFSGGLNSTVPEEMLKDNELSALKNQDLADRGATKRRSGMVKDFTPANTGKPQGKFRFYYNYVPINLVGPSGRFVDGNGDGLADGFYDFNMSSDNLSLANNVQTIKALAADTTNNRGIARQLSGFKPNAYYVYLINVLTDGAALGRITVRDERYPESDANHPYFTKDLAGSPTVWTTLYVKFQAFDGMTQGRSYFYNRTAVGSASSIQYKDARIYEITEDVYNKIDVDAAYTGENLGAKYPYASGQLGNPTSRVDDIHVVGGKFYINGVQTPVGDGSLAVQSTRPMEAVQFKGKLLIASGSGLLTWDGTNLTEQEPYKPDPMEALYVGYNALADDPYNFMADGQGTVLQCSGVTLDKRYGVVNQFITLSAWVLKPSGVTVEYLFEKKLETDKDYAIQQDWSTDSTCTFSTSHAGNYLFKVSVRKKGDTVESDIYYVPKYLIKPAADPNDNEIDGTTMSNCNRILLQAKRIMLYGDTAKPDVLYISHLNNPGYFPMNNTLRFDNPHNEGLSAITHFRDMLIAQTPTSTQALMGTSPQSYKRTMINPNVGCIAPYSAKVFGNYLAFLSYDGITILKTLQYSDSRANVDTIDFPVRTEIPKVDDACAEVFDNQYHIVFPSSKVRYRFYTQIQAYAKDESSKFDFARMFVYDHVLYGQRQDGSVLKFDPSALNDDGEVFEDYIETKSFNFGMPFNSKKLREVQLHFEDVIQATTITVKVLCDNKEVYNAPLSLVPGQEEPYKVQVAGKGQIIKVTLSHTEAIAYKLLSVAFIYKLKKP